LRGRRFYCWSGCRRSRPRWRRRGRTGRRTSGRLQRRPSRRSCRGSIRRSCRWTGRRSSRWTGWRSSRRTCRRSSWRSGGWSGWRASWGSGRWSGRRGTGLWRGSRTRFRSSRFLLLSYLIVQALINPPGSIAVRTCNADKKIANLIANAGLGPDNVQDQLGRRFVLAHQPLQSHVERLRARLWRRRRRWFKFVIFFL